MAKPNQEKVSELPFFFIGDEVVAIDNISQNVISALESVARKKFRHPYQIGRIDLVPDELRKGAGFSQQIFLLHTDGTVCTECTTNKDLVLAEKK